MRVFLRLDCRVFGLKIVAFQRFRVGHRCGCEVICQKRVCLAWQSLRVHCFREGDWSQMRVFACRVFFFWLEHRCVARFS